MFEFGTGTCEVEQNLRRADSREKYFDSDMNWDWGNGKSLGVAPI